MATPAGQCVFIGVLSALVPDLLFRRTSGFGILLDGISQMRGATAGRPLSKIDIVETIAYVRSCTETRDYIMPNAATCTK